MFRKSLLAAFVSLVAFACGGDGNGDGSGVDGGKTIVSLDGEERRSVCEYAVALVGGERTVDCGGGQTVTLGGTTSECEADLMAVASGTPNCPVTVSQYEACVEALGAATDAQICEAFPQECAPLFQQSCIPQ